MSFNVQFSDMTYIMIDLDYFEYHTKACLNVKVQKVSAVLKSITVSFLLRKRNLDKFNISIK
jgi:hypothetical protein